MAVDFSLITKILKLEEERGFTDTAVIGGLDQFLKRWASKVAPQFASPEDLSEFTKLIQSGYASMAPRERHNWSLKVSSFISRVNEKERPRKAEGISRAVYARRRSVKTKPTGSLDGPVTQVRGVSSSIASKLRHLGAKTVRDFLYLFPTHHIDFSNCVSIGQLEAGARQTVMASVWEAHPVSLGGRTGTEAIVGDKTGNIRVVWFNNPFLARQLRPGMRLVLSGKVGLFDGRLVMESPEWELEESELLHTGRLVPVYPLTQGLKERQMRRLVRGALDAWLEKVEDPLPLGIRERVGLLPLGEALLQAHFPDGQSLLDAARKRLAFDELLVLQLGVLKQKYWWQEEHQAPPLKAGSTSIGRFIDGLPFELTSAQKRVLREIVGDLNSSRPMSRLLQGEVGSGKTVIATAALLVAVASGCQGAIMAPTEILAEQHFNSISRLLSGAGREEWRTDSQAIFSSLIDRPIRLVRLIGELNSSEKRSIQNLIASGEADIIIGTHALIQEGVNFARLGLVVIDEQHRFGVAQRAKLREKGFSPHLLVMTATPIPRTLALTIYGDLDLSVIDELPPGRQVVKTRWIRPQQRYQAYDFIRREVNNGRQAFIICPLVEESEAIEAKAATAEYERLSKEVFPELRLGLLHGRMSASEKDQVMRGFRDGGLDILISTPVVEVGVDVPNATVMLVESAERFGLSQLHQFRGRVGRGEFQSYCILISHSPSEVSRMRLDVIEREHDGFRLAEEDLKMRGPGEFLGTRQSGLPDLKVARLSDLPLIELARKEARSIFEHDPALSLPEHRALADAVRRAWPGNSVSEWS